MCHLLLGLQKIYIDSASSRSLFAAKILKIHFETSFLKKAGYDISKKYQLSGQIPATLCTHSSEEAQRYGCESDEFPPKTKIDLIIGFDCAHHGDLVPKLLELEGILINDKNISVYRDKQYVIDEVNSMVEQILNIVSVQRHIKINNILKTN